MRDAWARFDSGGAAFDVSTMLATLRPWHWFVIAVVAMLALLLLWFAAAYGGLPRLWSHHEHQRITRRDAIISYTAQNIPADPVNLRLQGDAAHIACAFAKAGWAKADTVSMGSAVKIVASVVLNRRYAEAPVSSLYVQDRVQDIAFQLDAGKSAQRRHHVRLWQIAPGDWLAAATYDRGVGLSLFTLQITHHIGPDVDGERDAIGRLVIASGGRLIGTQPSPLSPGVWHRNGGGDRYRTDGMIKQYAVGESCS